MKTKSLQSAAILSIAVLLGCSTPHRVDGPRPALEKEIAALDDQAMSAYFRGDTATLRQLEANELVVIGDEGKAVTTSGRYESIDKQVKEGRWIPGGATRENESRTIQVFGPTAIVYGIALVKTPDTRERVAFSGVWMLRNGSWRFMHLHFHTVKGPQNP